MSSSSSSSVVGAGQQRRQQQRDRGSRRGGVVGRRGVVVRREGAAGVSEVQRARMLSSAVRVVAEHGYQRMSVARVAAGARVSRRTFYDVFSDREDCFLAIFDNALERVTQRVRGVYGDGTSADRDVWCGRVRCALTELLVFFDEEPRIASLLVVDSLAAGPRVLERRAQVLRELGVRLHKDGVAAGGLGAVAPLTGEGVIGAVFGVIHTRISQKDQGMMLALLSPLMGMIVLPYLGRGAARRELKRRGTTRASHGREQPAAQETPAGAGVGGLDVLEGLPMRITYRTLRVLGAIAEHPGASNRGVGEAADTHDQGQISKLLARLEKLGVIENTSGNGHRPTGEPNAWHLTPRGQQIEHALRIGPDDDAPKDGARNRSPE